MYAKKNCKKFQLEIAETMKVMRKSISSIMQTINRIKVRIKKKVSKHEKMILQDIHGVLTSIHLMLQYIFHHAKSPDEIYSLRQTDDIVKQICTELKQLTLISTN